ncbi:MAG: PBSX family phage terminase large subunit [Bacteroidia bacterium]
MAITIKWCDWLDIINESFEPLIDNTDRYLILKGGRGSAKSDWCAKKLIYRCLTDKYFRYILIRKNYNSIEDSSYQTIKDIVHDLGLESLFTFTKQPLAINCINGNKFIARGCDDTTKLKSIKDPTGAWYEEDIVTEEDFITITSSIRTTKASYLQEIFTINPEVEGNYQDHWFWKRFFKDKLENACFSDITKVNITRYNAETKVMEDKVIEMPYTVHHSTFNDNKWIPDSFVALLQDLKRTNPYYYTIYCLGHWGNKVLGGLFYKKFNIGKNTFNFKYDKSIPLHISFDFNVSPYLSVTIWQAVGKALYLIDEIAMESPKNTTKDACTEIKRRYFMHEGGVFIYGDPSGKNEDTRTEKGWNDFKIISTELSVFRPVERVARMHPPVAMRGNFINEIFENTYDGISINIYEGSVYLKNDFLFGKEASDGTKDKTKVKDKVKDITYEKYHHHSDSADYLICMMFAESFGKYQNGNVVFNRSIGRAFKHGANNF